MWSSCDKHNNIVQLLKVRKSPLLLLGLLLVGHHMKGVLMNLVLQHEKLNLPLVTTDVSGSLVIVAVKAKPSCLVGCCTKGSFLLHT